MNTPTRPDKVRARDVLETRVRTRIAQLHKVLTRDLAPQREDAIFFDPQTHRLRATRHHMMRLAPDATPRHPHRAMPMTEALATIAAETEAIVAHTVEAMWTRVHSPLVPGAALRGAVLGREALAARWPWDEDHEASAVLAALVFSLEPVLAYRLGADAPPWGDTRLAGGEPKPYGWPADVAPRAVADWAASILKDERDALARFRAAGEAGDWGRIDHPARALAVLFAVKQTVEQDRDERDAMAIDAGRPNHDLISGWRDLPKDPHTPHPFSTIDGRIELLAPTPEGEHCVQLLLFDDESPSEALITALRELRRWKGLRHWAAVQKLLSVDGGRQGWVRWTLDGHLDALGVSVKHRSKTDLRVSVAHQVEAFTKLELAVYAKDGTLRSRKKLLIVGEKYDRLKGSRWELDGMQLTINPLLYAGVREKPGGRLGRNWHPAPVELAQVNDKDHPHTLALGLILPIRWRLALEEDHDHITLTGASALRLAGITYKAHQAARAWQKLERDLAELARIDGLGRWEWDAADTPRTLGGRLHLWPAPWMLDRTIAGVRPRELPAGPIVLTGAELKAWRTRRGLTQATAAAELKVSRDSILRAEKHPSEPLSTALTAKMRAVRA